jgi:hypothetical protein
MFRVLVMAAVAVSLASCATGYQQNSITGGFDTKELRPDVYRVSFQGNGFTTRETVQTYWLNRCAELAIEKGYAGFEILTDMRFVMRRPSVDDRDRLALDSSAVSLRTHIPVSSDEAADFAVWRERDRLASQPAAPVRLAAAGGVMIFYSAPAAPKPAIEGDVHFLPAPVEPAPPKIFNAKALLAQLEPIVKGTEQCNGNVCPHVHEYLLPKGKLR